MMRLFVAIALVSLPALAFAQEPAPPAPVAATAPAAPRGSESNPIVIQAGPVITPARPSATYFVARSRPEPRLEDLRASFTTEIVATAARAPF